MEVRQIQERWRYEDAQKHEGVSFMKIWCTNDYLRQMLGAFWYIYSVFPSPGKKNIDMKEPIKGLKTFWLMRLRLR